MVAYFERSVAPQGFYPLTHEEWVEAHRHLKPAEVCVLYHLRTFTPFGDRPTPVSVREIGRILNLNPSTVSRALKRLDRLGYIELELAEVRITLLSKGLLFERNHPEIQVLEDENPLPEVLSTDPECCLQTTPEIARQHPGSLGNTQGPEPSLRKGSKFPKTLKTLKDQIKKKREKKTEKISLENEQKEDITSESSLASVTVQVVSPQPKPKATDWKNFSAPGDDANFFDFVVNKAAKFNNPVPADVRCAAEGWIRKQGHLLYPEYLRWQEAQRQAEERLASAGVVVSTPPQVEPESETVEQRLERYQSLWKTPVCRKGIKEMIAEHPEWGLAIGPNGPQWAEVAVEVPVVKVAAVVPSQSWVSEPVLDHGEAIPDDLSDVLVEIDLHVWRLGWDAEQMRRYLQQNYGKHSRQMLSGQELLDFLSWLQKE